MVAVETRDDAALLSAARENVEHISQRLREQRQDLIQTMPEATEGAAAIDGAAEAASATSRAIENALRPSK